MDHCKYEDVIEDVKKALFGNARKGLVEKVTSLQVQMRIVLLGISIIVGCLIKLILQ